MKETPYLIFKEKILEENYKEFDELCRKYLSNYIIAYSVKTNSFENLIKKLSELDSSFEVASIDEIINVSGKTKVFNGPNKTEEELKIAMEKNLLINVDNKSEIDKIINLKKGRKLSIGLRVNFNDNKFGFEEDKVKDIINYCSTNNLNVVGFSFHPGTQVNIKDYEYFIKKIENFLISIDINLDYLDIGGGFPDRYQLKNLNVKNIPLENVISNY